MIGAPIYRVNSRIVLKLERNLTNIYIDGVFFQQCKKLIIKIPVDDINSISGYGSIDDLIAMKGSLNTKSDNFSPEEEFWGHCSSLQVWVENDYDTRLIDSRLAFPLLRKLAESGDIKARKALKDEIIYRIEAGRDSNILYILENNYLEIFTQSEISMIYENIMKTKEFSSPTILLTVLKSFQELLGVKEKYARLVKEQIIRDNWAEKINIIKNHTDVLTINDLLYIYEKLVSSNAVLTMKFYALDLILEELYHRNYELDIDDISKYHIHQSEQKPFLKVVKDSDYSYHRLDFQSDEIRRRIWNKKLYYFIFGGHLINLELCIDNNNPEKINEQLEILGQLPYLECINILFLIKQNNLMNIRRRLQNFNFKDLKFYDFSNFV